MDQPLPLTGHRFKCCLLFEKTPIRLATPHPRLGELNQDLAHLFSLFSVLDSNQSEKATLIVQAENTFTGAERDCRHSTHIESVTVREYS